MMAGTHMETGAVAWTGVLVAGLTAATVTGTPVPEAAVFPAIAGYPLTVFATLWSDVDTPGSKISRMLLGPFGPVRKYVVRFIAGPLGGHRGGTHTVWAVLTVGAVLGLVAPWVGFAAALGVAAHIYGDCYTKSGVAVFWPLSDHVVRLGKVRTGSAVGEGWWRLKQAGIGIAIAAWGAAIIVGFTPAQLLA